MLLDTAQLSTDLANIIAELPGTLIVDGVSVQAGFSSLNRGDRLTMTGDVQELDFRAVLPISSLTDEGAAVPEEGDTVIATPPGQSATNCKVVSRIYPQAGVSVILELQIDRRNPIPFSDGLTFEGDYLTLDDDLLRFTTTI